jgi:hypothetical protein
LVCGHQNNSDASAPIIATIWYFRKFTILLPDLPAFEIPNTSGGSEYPMWLIRVTARKIKVIEDGSGKGVFAKNALPAELLPYLIICFAMGCF